MSSLSENQRLVLITAAERTDGALLPLPEGLTARGRARQLLLQGLINRGLIAKRPTQEGEPAWSERDGEQSTTLEITPQGRAAIEAEREAPLRRQRRRHEAAARRPAEARAEPAAIRPGTKQSLLVELLRRPDGATIAEIQQATGWLPHSTRAALTGLRKKSFAVTSARRGDGARAYRLPAEDTGEDERTS